VARVAVGDLVDEAPSDVRALLADLELAWVDGRHDELDVILDQLAQAVADRALAGAMARARGLLAEARGDDGGPAYRGALLVDPADRLAWMGLAHAACARGAASEAAELTGHLVGQGGLGLASPALAGALEWRRGEPLIGRGELASAGRSIARAAELLPGDPELGEVHALLLEAAGQAGQAAEALARAASATPSRGHAARLLRRAAGLRAASGDKAASMSMLHRAVELDPGEPLAAIDLAGALEAAGDDEGLVALARRQVSADPDGAVLARIRLARGLERLGRGEEATAVLAAGRAAGPRSAARDAELERAYARGGKLAERAALCREQAEERLPYVDPLVAERRAATALEQLAAAAGPAPTPARARAGTGAPGEDPAGTIPPRDADDDWGDVTAAAPEILFASPSSADGGGAPEAAGLPAGIWREPNAGGPAVRARGGPAMGARRWPRGAACSRSIRPRRRRGRRACAWSRPRRPTMTAPGWRSWPRPRRASCPRPAPSSWLFAAPTSWSPAPAATAARPAKAPIAPKTPTAPTAPRPSRSWPPPRSRTRAIRGPRSPSCACSRGTGAGPTPRGC